MAKKYNFGHGELYNFLKDNPGYIKWGASKIRNKFCHSGVDTQDIYEIRSEVREALESSKDRENPYSDSTNENINTTEEDDFSRIREGEYEDYIQERWKKFKSARGITDDDIKSVKYWETMQGEPRFSVVPFSNHNLNFDALEDRFREKLEDIEPPDFSSNGKLDYTPEEVISVLSIHDGHIDKLSLASETGYDTDATIDDNCESFKSNFVELCEDGKRRGTSQLVFQAGSDYWTQNGNDSNSTKRGTPQRVNIDWHQAYELGMDTLTECIAYASSQFPEVLVIVTYGNHAPDLCFHMGLQLEMTFKNTPNVTIDRERQERKYVLFGKVGLGFAHGYNSKSKAAIRRLLPNMVNEAPELTYKSHSGIRKFFLGDIHHEKEYMFLRGEDGQGLQVQFMRSAGRSGKYEWDNGWSGTPKSAYLWSYPKDASREWVDKIVWR